MYPIEAELDDAVRPWLSRAAELIRRRVRDARMHTENRAWVDAAERFDELASGLAIDVLGPAREEFYRHAFGAQRRALGPGVANPAVVPTREGAIMARTANVGGINQQLAVRNAIDHARHELQSAMAACEIDPTRRTVHYEAWEWRTRERLTSEVKSHLSDAQSSLYHAVGKLLLPARIR